MTEPDPDFAAFQAEQAKRRTRRDQLIAEHGRPEEISGADALALVTSARVPVDPTVTPDDVYASIYRDQEAASAWGESNRVHNGHPTLARVPLPDGRVVGILDLRPARKRMAEREVRHDG
jgi:hypothetical protein